MPYKSPSRSPLKTLVVQAEILIEPSRIEGIGGWNQLIDGLSPYEFRSVRDGVQEIGKLNYPCI